MKINLIQDSYTAVRVYIVELDAINNQQGFDVLFQNHSRDMAQYILEDVESGLEETGGGIHPHGNGWMISLAISHIDNNIIERFNHHLLKEQKVEITHIFRECFLQCDRLYSESSDGREEYNADAIIMFRGPHDSESPKALPLTRRM